MDISNIAHPTRWEDLPAPSATCLLVDANDRILYNIYAGLTFGFAVHRYGSNPSTVGHELYLTREAAKAAVMREIGIAPGGSARPLVAPTEEELTHLDAAFKAEYEAAGDNLLTHAFVTAGGLTRLPRSIVDELRPPCYVVWGRRREGVYGMATWAALNTAAERTPEPESTSEPAAAASRNPWEDPRPGDRFRCIVQDACYTIDRIVDDVLYLRWDNVDYSSGPGEVTRKDHARYPDQLISLADETADTQETP